MKKGMEDVLSRYADGWNLANFLKFACLKGDEPEMKALTGRMDEAAWAVWDEQNYSESCKALGTNRSAVNHPSNRCQKSTSASVARY